MRHRGRPWDAVQAYARTAEAVTFVTSFAGLQRTMRFGRGQFTREQAYTLAAAWCGRMLWYYDEWEEAGCGRMVFGAAPDGIACDEDLVNLMLELGMEHPCWERGQAIRSLVPGAWLLP